MNALPARPPALSGLTVGLIGLTFAVAGCGGSSSKAAAVSPGSSAAPQAAASAPTHVEAKGGGNFCQLIAASANNASISGTSADVIKKHVAEVQGLEQQAIDASPNSLKSDVHLLFNASNRVYAALAKVNYDYSKITATDVSALQAPGVVQAEQRLTAYVTNVCKIKS
jgi:hypothetical protein